MLNFSTDTPIDDCSICLDPFNKAEKQKITGYKQTPNIDLGSIEITRCHHVFHRQCLNRWRDTRDICPLCRTNLSDIIDDSMDMYNAQVIMIREATHCIVGAVPFMVASVGVIAHYSYQTLNTLITQFTCDSSLGCSSKSLFPALMDHAFQLVKTEAIVFAVGLVTAYPLGRSFSHFTHSMYSYTNQFADAEEQ